AILHILVAVVLSTSTGAAERSLDTRLHHLRSGGGEREWAEFPERAAGHQLEITFTAEPNAEEHTLRLRHRDLKQTWKLSLNDRELGTLPPDENDTVTFWAIPPRILRAGENRV